MYQDTQNEKRRSFGRVRFWVQPNQTGFLYRKNQLEKRLEPGIYDYFDWSRHLYMVALPKTGRLVNVTNQEVLSKDNIALRFSYFVEYRISDAEKFIESFDVFTFSYNIFQEAEQLVHTLTQAHFRAVISEIESEELNDRRGEILPEIPESLKIELSAVGIEIVRLMVRDLTFPKSIQDLFSKQLEAKIRSRADLENARTTVATARALKNASEIMKDDDNVRFIQYLETITKIADKGKHTFVIGSSNANAVDLK
jgi:regulator of protease activity HflC (stomatin/prohibitin superfamily)